MGTYQNPEEMGEILGHLLCKTSNPRLYFALYIITTFMICYILFKFS